jgi:hypothetical protein
MKQDFLHAALGYLENGFFVFPLRPRSKTPLTPNGFKDASNDPAQIKAWWAQHPTANIGIATGEISGLWVLDIDGAYPENWPQLPATAKVKTHQGWHFYFKYPSGQDIRCRAKIDGLPIDVRGNGGFIVAPPSEHPEGGYYEFVIE